MAGLREVGQYLETNSLLGMAGKIGLSRPISAREVIRRAIGDAHQIKHVFVLMLENRAFDHMLGFAGITGTGIDGNPTRADDLVGRDASNTLDWPPGGTYPAKTPAEFKMSGADPGHEFLSVVLQLCGAGSVYPAPGGGYPPINNSGFVDSYQSVWYGGVIMNCFAREQLPVLVALAEEFALCDRWFSSVPGPTWPNRFFLHAASSGGLDDSPSGPDVFWAEKVDGYTFEHGTIFGRLQAHGLDWMIFEGDEFPQAQGIAGMDDDRFHDITHFRKYIQDPGLTASYIFIEPDYGHTVNWDLSSGDYTCGTSQHPVDDITSGEWLIKAVYDIIRNSPHWKHSVLVITWDEHGGFYDHVTPPPATAPGDAFSDDDINVHGFDFRQLGVRVPAVIVSPLIPKNTIDHTVYDHSSVPATIERLFGLEPLTERDRNANSFEHLFSLDLPRTDAPVAMPSPAVSGYHCDDSPAVELSKLDEPMEARLRGFAHVAFKRNYKLSAPEARPAVVAEYQSLRTNRDVLDYMKKVRPKVRMQMGVPIVRPDPFAALGIQRP